MDWRALLLSPNGRIRRGEFWTGFALVMATSAAVNLFQSGVSHVLGLVLLWPQVCIHAKRLHDIGRSAWLLLVPFSVSLIALAVIILNSGPALFVDGAGDGTLTTAACLVVMVLDGVGFLSWVGLSAGDPEANRYGPPRDPV